MTSRAVRFEPGLLTMRTARSQVLSSIKLHLPWPNPSWPKTLESPGARDDACTTRPRQRQRRRLRRSRRVEPRGVEARLEEQEACPPRLLLRPADRRPGLPLADRRRRRRRRRRLRRCMVAALAWEWGEGAEEAEEEGVQEPAEALAFSGCTRRCRPAFHCE